MLPLYSDEMVEKMRTTHNSEGHAFQTFDTGVDVNADYGDTTMSFDFQANIAKETDWKVASIERVLSEPYQIAVGIDARS